MTDTLLDDQLLKAVPMRGGKRYLEPCVLLCLLGRGGMGAVYGAWHVNLDIPVAVKCLFDERADDVTAVKRFAREANVAARLDSPYLTKVYDTRSLGSLRYLVMEYVHGEDLRRRIIRKSALHEREALTIARDAARGLATGHEAGVVHRDVKPDNILISTKGDVKVTDLGLAKFETGSEPLVTSANMLVGTPQYMAPEQYDDVGGHDPASDVYALGVTLYFMLAGADPFGSLTAHQVIREVCTKGLPDVSDVRKDLHPDVVALVRRATASDRAERHADARALEADIVKILGEIGGPVALSDAAAEPPLAEPVRRPPAAVLDAVMRGDVPAAPNPTVIEPNETVLEAMPTLTEDTLAHHDTGIALQPPTTAPPGKTRSKARMWGALLLVAAVVAALAIFVPDWIGDDDADETAATEVEKEPAEVATPTDKEARPGEDGSEDANTDTALEEPPVAEPDTTPDDVPNDVPDGTAGDETGGETGGSKAREADPKPEPDTAPVAEPEPITPPAPTVDELQDAINASIYRERWDDALRDLVQLVRLHPGHEDYVENRLDEIRQTIAPGLETVYGEIDQREKTQLQTLADEHDSPTAALILGETSCYHSGYAFHAMGDPTRYLERAAAADIAEAHYYLGELYYPGSGEPADADLSYRSFERALEHGIPGAGARMAVMCLDDAYWREVGALAGLTEDARHTKGLRLARDAASAGSAEGMEIYARMLLNDRFGKDTPRAKKLLIDSANLGYEPAVLWCIAAGERDTIEWDTIHESVEAELHGFSDSLRPLASFIYAVILDEGLDSHLPAPDKAKRYFESAAAQTSVPAMIACIERDYDVDIANVDLDRLLPSLQPDHANQAPAVEFLRAYQLEARGQATPREIADAYHSVIMTYAQPHAIAAALELPAELQLHYPTYRFLLKNAVLRFTAWKTPTGKTREPVFHGNYRNQQGFYTLAKMYEQGIGGPVDMSTAREHYKFAARSGHWPARQWCQANGVTY